MPAGTILLVETDGPSAALLSAALTVQGHEVTTVGDAAEAYRRAPEHDVVVIDVLPGSAAVTQLCDRIRSTPELAKKPILAISASDDIEERVALLEAGADDVIWRPFDPSELDVRVEALLVRLETAGGRGFVGDRAGAPLGQVHVVSVYSPKGGVGTTTIAVNLAVAAAAAAPGRVLIADLDVRWGQVATHLNLTAPNTLVDLIRDQAALEDPGLLRSYTARHESGLHVLAAPSSAASADFVAADVTAAALRTAVEEFDLIVVDAGSELDSLSLMALDLADAVILPVVADIPSLKPVVQLLEYLNETGSVADKTSVVLNQIFGKQLVAAEQIEDLLGLKISARIPHEETGLLKAANEGEPIVRLAPKSAAAGAFVKLASAIVGTAAPATTLDASRGLFRKR